MDKQRNSLSRFIVKLGLTGLGLLVFASPTIAAEIYKTVDSDGNIVFSDQPAEEAEKIEVQAPVTFDSSVMTNPYGSTSKNIDSSEEPVKFKYSRLEITSPENDSAIRDNAGNFELSYAIEPPAPAEHIVQLIMDGKVHSTVSRSGTTNFENTDRGTHVFELRVIHKKSKKVIKKSPASSVSILRFIPPRPSHH